MGQIAAFRSNGREENEVEELWADNAHEAKAKMRLVQELHHLEHRGSSACDHRRKSISATIDLSSFANPAILGRIAAVLVIGVIGGLALGYRLGLRSHSSTGRTPLGAVVRSSSSEAPPDIAAQRVQLTAQLDTAYKGVAELKARSERDERALEQTKALRASVEQKLQQLDADDKQKSNSIESVSMERDVLQRKLDESQQTLQSVRADLTRLQDERQRMLLRTTGLETTIDGLSAQLNESREAQRDDVSSASDSEIREVVGARQLYIADVFDVDQDGQKRKPFGRLFYSKGKSLIFYAFDLDEQPAARRAKAFQVWGSPGVDEAHAFSLGVFYMDSEANRRWVFKSDDPKALAQVNTVFVTMEPKGESRSPSGKPILYAYLRTALPNHP
jgi:hypothetical protein